MNAPSKILNSMTELHRFLFCSSHGAHGQWLSSALRGAGIVLQESDRPALLQQRVMDLDAQVVLLDFSGDADPATSQEGGGGGITYATELARVLTRCMPAVPLVAVGSTTCPEGAVAALRAGVHEFIDMSRGADEALEVVRRVLEGVHTAPAAAPLRHGRFVVLLGVRPGVGCSTLSAHLTHMLQAHGLRSHGEAVPASAGASNAPDAPLASHAALLDLGLPAGDCSLYLNTQSDFNFAQAVLNLRRLDETLVHTAMGHHASGFVVLPLPRDLTEMRSVAHADALALTDRLRGFFDVTVADLGGFSNTAFLANLARAADEVWLVTDQSVGAIVSLASLLRELEDSEVPRGVMQLVVNRYDPRYGMAADQIARRFELPLCGVLPDRPVTLLAAANQGKLACETAPQDAYVRALKPLAERLSGPGSALPPQGRRWLGKLMRK